VEAKISDLKQTENDSLQQKLIKPASDRFEKTSQKLIAELIEDLTRPPSEVHSFALRDELGQKSYAEGFDYFAYEHKQDDRRDAWVERVPVDWLPDFFEVVNPSVASQKFEFYGTDEWNCHVPIILGYWSRKDAEYWYRIVLSHLNEETADLIFNSLANVDREMSTRVIETVWPNIRDYADEHLKILVEITAETSHAFSPMKLAELQNIVTTKMPESWDAFKIHFPLLATD
jgi:hypothetical protein